MEWITAGGDLWVCSDCRYVCTIDHAKDGCPTCLGSGRRPHDPEPVDLQVFDVLRLRGGLTVRVDRMEVFEGSGVVTIICSVLGPMVVDAAAVAPSQRLLAPPARIP